MATFIPVTEAVELPLLANDDYLKRGKGRLLKWSKYIFEDLNLDVLKKTTREYFNINKRTNSIDLPCNIDEVSSVSVVAPNGTIYPVWVNGRLHKDIVDVAAEKDCACEYKCGHKLCNLIKGYEACVSTKTDKLPNGDDISFTCVDRRGLLGEMFYEERQYPLRVYESGIWVDTILYTEKKELCTVELDVNGCVCDTDQNMEKLCNTCVDDSDKIPHGGTSTEPPYPDAKRWSYYCNSILNWFSVQCGSVERFKDSYNNIYNITDSGNRLIFPANFGFSKVLVRYYKSQNLKDLQIPMIAVPTFILGLKWWDTRFNDKMQNLAVKYESDYTKSKWGLLGELNRRRIAEFRMITTPPVFMPSYVQPYFFTNYSDFN